ncbi:MAG: M13 family metallopeptidase [Elusimicrobiota bacterium]|nr:MAG: M13 family metallopeptidase [Elusimicrobiota bacterium]
MIRTFLLLPLLALPSFAADAPKPISGFDPAAMDLTASPCGDFYQYACGGWLKANPIPSDQSRWGRFNELAERNKLILREVLEASAVKPKGEHGARTGALYGACMDEAAVEAAGLKPLSAAFDAIAGLSSAGDLAPLLGRLHRAGVNAGFGYGSEQDYKDSAKVIAGVDQAGLGLPDRDYYLKDDAKSVELRRAYEWHVARSLGLAGDAPAAAAEAAAAVMRVETALAKSSMDRVARRDPANTYHKMTRAELAALAPGFGWDRYLDAAGGPAWKDVNVSSPDFVKGFGALLGSAPLPDLKAYLRWRVLSAAEPYLGRAFVEENFDFYGRRLTGAKELKPRWKRCVELVDRSLGEDLGRGYVEKAYPPETKKKMDALVVAVVEALRKDIEGLDWMTPATKAKALAKLGTMGNKVGYPEKWRDYSSVKIDRKDLVGSVRSAIEFEHLRQLRKIGKPVDRKEWHMTPPTVNAYYNPQMNDINFPAGILQPPFFDPAMPDAVNLGAIGAVIGHELTHGFDDQGRKFDLKGNMEDWWTAEDAKAFESRAQCFVDQYGSYEAAPGLKLNGKLTLGENTADNGGLLVAGLAVDAQGPKEPWNGFTPRQLLYLGFAQIWCQNRTEQVARMLAQVDPHSAARWRVIGPLSNSPEFAKAFSCKSGDAMVAPKACRVW